LPPKLIGKHVWRDRFESIRDFEKHLARNGTVVLKFFLNLSKDEQRRRLLSRIDEPDKHWKFDAGDLAERKHWDDYQGAYQHAIAETRDQARALACRSGRQQMVHPAHRRSDDRRSPGKARSAVPDGR
jgi:polyphosphate kinase 2 (PPK2 family)